MIMEITRLTTKGQLVIPKRIREAVRAAPGTRFAVSIRGSAILLELLRPKSGSIDDWKGLNPKRIRLSDSVLCAPVVLDERK